MSLTIIVFVRSITSAAHLGASREQILIWTPQQAGRRPSFTSQRAAASDRPLAAGRRPARAVKPPVRGGRHGQDQDGCEIALSFTSPERRKPMGHFDLPSITSLHQYRATAAGHTQTPCRLPAVAAPSTAIQDRSEPTTIAAGLRSAGHTTF